MEKIVAKAGSVLGGSLLIAGSCIGAGMLALPIMTGIAGFLPTLIMFFLAWAFMTATAFLLVEVNASFEHPVNFISMVGRTLGNAGRAFSWTLYLFLFYSLLIAYLSASGNQVTFFTQQVLSIKIPTWIGALFFVLVFGWVVYLGTKPVDYLNRLLMFFKILAYLGIIGFGLYYISPKMLAYHDMRYAFFSLPLLIVSFGFHNMIPSLTAYMKGDTRRVRQAILYGSLFTLVIYLLWEIVSLGILPIDGKFGILESYQQDATAAQAIRNYMGSDFLGLFAEIFSFFAILTSFLAQSMSLVHFLRDGFKVHSTKRENIPLCILALLPPLIVSWLYPQMFFKALNFAGGFCAVILFGVIPVLMVWVGRYRHKIESSYKIRGGQGLLVVILVFALFVLFYQLCTMLGIKLFPVP